MTYKRNLVRNSRTGTVVVGLSKLGDLQRTVLLVVRRRFSSRTFTISDVRVTLREEFSIDVDRRRLWDVFQRLVRRGIIERVGRGLYRLVKDLDESLLKLTELKDSLYWGVGGGVGCGVGGGVGVGGGGVVRVHGCCGDVFVLVRRLVFWCYYLGFRVREVVGFLRRYYGVSKYLVRRLVRVARELARVVAGFDVVVGGHGFYGRRYRGFKKFSSLVPLAYLDGGHVYELGFDAEVPEELTKELMEFLGGSGFLKLYVKPLRGR
jgi:hypothetical protein